MWREWADEVERRVLSREAGGCILEIKPGAGGRDAADVGREIVRMYLKWLGARRWSYEYEATHNDDGGIESATITVDHPRAWGLLEGESGPHRMSHRSRYGRAGKRQTSFVAVRALPLVEASEYSLDPAELVWTTFAGSSKGGQHANKSSTNVRVKHGPSGLGAQSCGRSLRANKDAALRVLSARVGAHYAPVGEGPGRVEAGFGSRRRSYVETPRPLVVDHPTGYKTRLGRTLDGDLDVLLWRGALMRIVGGR